MRTKKINKWQIVFHSRKRSAFQRCNGYSIVFKVKKEENTVTVQMHQETSPTLFLLSITSQQQNNKNKMYTRMNVSLDKRGIR